MCKSSDCSEEYLECASYDRTEVTRERCVRTEESGERERLAFAFALRVDRLRICVSEWFPSGETAVS